MFPKGSNKVESVRGQLFQSFPPIILGKCGVEVVGDMPNAGHKDGEPLLVTQSFGML